MTKIENIIVATDFSPTARNAYYYAKSLADTLGATLTVVHITDYFMPDSAIDVLQIPDLEVQRMATEAMTTFVEEEDNADEWVMVKNKVKTRIIKGNCVDSLVALSKKEDIHLIVMGTTGLEDFLTKIIGTISHEVSNRAQCPVILVPRNAVWQKIDSIMYASSFESVAPKMLQSVIDFAQAVQGAIHYVHVEDFSFDDAGNVNKKILDNLYLPKMPNTPIDIHSVYNIDKIEGLQQYSEENDINLMVFASKHRSFWENVVHKSVTANIAITTHIPMMVIHFDDDGAS